MKPILTLTALLLMATVPVVPVASETPPPASETLSDQLGLSLPLCQEELTTGEGCESRVQEPELQANFSTLTHCQVVRSCTGYKYTGECCRNGKKHLVNDCTECHRCYPDDNWTCRTIYNYACSDDSWCS